MIEQATHIYRNPRTSPLRATRLLSVFSTTGVRPDSVEVLGGTLRVSWRGLFPCALATGVFWLGMEVVFRFFFSGMVISEDQEYGPIGIVFAIMSFLIAIGVVVVLGAVVGLVWQERGLSVTAALRQLRRAQ